MAAKARPAPPDRKQQSHKEAAMSALNEQPGGSHYKGKAIQPVQYIHANGIGYCEGNVIKYVSRWREKNGLQDLLKARHYIDLLIELEGLEKAEFGQQNTIDCRTEAEKGFNDPRTVEGVDVSFPTEKHMNFAPVQCEHYFEDHGCYRFGSRGQQLTIWNCAKCGAEKVEAEDE
jgi:hypothetical protein